MGAAVEQVEAHLLRLSVCSLDSDAAEPENAARAASSRQQLVDQRLVLLLQRQHDSGLQDGHRCGSLTNLSLKAEISGK